MAPIFVDSNEGSEDRAGANKRGEEKGLEEIRKIARRSVEQYRRLLEKRGKEKASGVIYDMIKGEYGVDKDSRWFKGMAIDLDSSIFHYKRPVEANRNILLIGPPGTGKTFLITKLVENFGVPIIIDSGSINPDEIKGKFQLAREFRRVIIEEAIKIEFSFGLDKLYNEVAKELFGIKTQREEKINKIKDKAREIIIREIAEGLKANLEREDQLLDLISPTNPHIASSSMSSLLTALKKKMEKTINSLEEAKEISEEAAQLLREEFVEKLTSSNVLTAFNSVLVYPPTIIVIDEIDALGNREVRNNKVLTNLLQEIDGATPPNLNNGISIFAATNISSFLDQALTRQGRFGTKIIFHYPNLRARREIIEVKENNFGNPLAKFSEGAKEVLLLMPLATGADIMGIMDRLIKIKVGRTAGSEFKKGPVVITPQDAFEEVLKKVREPFIPLPGISVKGGSFWVKEMGKLYEGVDTGKVRVSKKFGDIKEIMMAYELSEELLEEMKKEETRDIEDRFLVEEVESRIVDRMIESIPFIIGYSEIVDSILLKALSEEGSLLRIFGENTLELIAMGVVFKSVEKIKEVAEQTGSIISDPLLVAEINMANTLRGIVGQSENVLKTLFNALEAMENTIVVIKNFDVYSHQRSFSSQGEIAVITESIERLIDRGRTVIVDFPKGITTPSSLNALENYLGLFTYPGELVALVFSPLDRKILHYISFKKTDPELKEKMKEFLKENGELSYKGIEEYLGKRKLKEITDSESYIAFIRKIRDRNIDLKKALKKMPN